MRGFISVDEPKVILRESIEANICVKMFSHGWRPSDQAVAQFKHKPYKPYSSRKKQLV